jgi:hypothetical protein
VEQQPDPDYYSNRLLKSNFKALIPVKDSLISEKASKEEKRKKRSSKSTGKKTRKEKAEYQLQKNLRKGHDPSRSGFQSSLPALTKVDPKLYAKSNAPDLKKPSKVHPVDFDVNPNKETAALDPVNPLTADGEDPALNRPQSPRSGGLVVSRHNKVHPLNAEGSLDVRAELADQEQLVPGDLIELANADLSNAKPKFAFDFKDKPGTSKV